MDLKVEVYLKLKIMPAELSDIQIAIILNLHNVCARLELRYTPLQKFGNTCNIDINV